VSFYLAAADGAPLPTFKPGQYITVRATTPQGSTTMRNYSLSDKPGQEWFRISVKREVPPEANTPGGYVSNRLHDEVESGDTIEIAPPCGDFFLDVTEKHDRPLVLLAAGVGITPIMGILLAALDAMGDRKIFFIHASLNENVQAFKSTIDGLEMKHPNLKSCHLYSDAGPRSGNAITGFVTAELIESLVPKRNAVEMGSTCLANSF
jgi:nitric oxide dioxygenase